MSLNYETFGKYILLEKVATGGMAEIYLGRSVGASGIGKFVAIKRILPQFSENTAFIDMFIDEAKIAVNLTHSNIVSIFEFGVERKQFFIVMDYVEGRNLRQILNKMKKSEATFSIEQVVYIVKEIAMGLDHAHRCLDSKTGRPLNIIHRDMSPQNVMVSFEGEVKIVDFGIAKAETQIENTRAGELKGKFGYMSPEQAEGQLVDVRTDIFSLGIVLWELLANDRLFVANNEVNTLRKVRDCHIPSLRKINPSIPPELERIVSKSLAKDRSLRYQTAAAFHRDLSSFLNRHYPDFLPADFSTFIKNLFASEILDSRKKMIEYAKVDANPTSSQRPNSSDNFTETTTVTGTGTGDTIPDLTGGAELDRPKAGYANPFSPIDRSASNTTPIPSALLANQSNDMRIDTRGLITTRDSSVSGSYTPSGTSVSYRSFKRSKQAKKRKNIAPRAFAALAILLLVTAVAYTAMNMKNPIGRIWNAAAQFGLGRNATEQASKAPPAHTPEPLPQVRQQVAYHEVKITSSLSGAVIRVDGAIAPEVTPARLQLPAGKTVVLSIEMEGYIPYTETFVVDGPRVIKADLQTNTKGYLDVIVNGTGRIAIDGRIVAAGSPAQNIAIPADQDVMVSVFDPITNAAANAKVRVSPGARKKIVLNPRIIGRSGSDASQKQ